MCYYIRVKPPFSNVSVVGLSRNVTQRSPKKRAGEPCMTSQKTTAEETIVVWKRPNYLRSLNTFSYRKSSNTLQKLYTRSLISYWLHRRKLFTQKLIDKSTPLTTKTHLLLIKLHQKHNIFSCFLFPFKKEH